MSRVGRKPVTLPEGVTVTVDSNNHVVVKGPKGSLEYTFNHELTIDSADNKVLVSRPSDSQWHRTIHGTTRALINNMVVGVSEGFKKELEIKGVGYRAQLKGGNTLVVNAGYSNPVELSIPKGLQVEVPNNIEIVVKGMDKQLVGEFAAEIRGVREPEPYLGKGIRYKGEHVRHKEGKTAKK